MSQAAQRQIAPYIYAAISLVFTALLLWYVGREQTFSSFMEMLSRINKTGLAVFVLLSTGGILLRALRYYYLLRIMSDNDSSPNFGQMVVVTLARNALVDLLPARLGELSYFAMLKAYGVKLSLALGTFGLCLVLDIFVLALLFSAILVLQSEAGAAAIVGSSILAFLLLLALLSAARIARALRIWIAGFRDYADKRLSARAVNVLDAAEQFAARIAQDMERLYAKPRQGLVLFLITLGLRAAKYLSLYILLLAILDQFNVDSGDIPLLVCTIAFIFAEGAASLPMSGIMGFGAYEAVWLGVLRTAEVNIVQDSSVILAVHLITQIVGYTLGAVGLACFGVSCLRKRTSAFGRCTISRTDV